MKLGAYDYISKPYRMAEIDVLVRRAWEKRRSSRARTAAAARGSRASTPSREMSRVYAPMQAVLALRGTRRQERLAGAHHG